MLLRFLGVAFILCAVLSGCKGEEKSRVPAPQEQLGTGISQ